MKGYKLKWQHWKWQGNVELKKKKIWQKIIKQPDFTLTVGNKIKKISQNTLQFFRLGIMEINLEMLKVQFGIF